METRAIRRLANNRALHQDLFTLVAVVGIAVGGFLIGMSLFVSSITPTYTAPIVPEIPPSPQPQERFLIGVEEDRAASDLYFDKDDYFLLAVYLGEERIRSFEGVTFELIDHVDEGRCQAWNVAITFPDATREEFHHDYLCGFDRPLHFVDSLTLTAHNSPRAGILFDVSVRQMYYVVSKDSLHFPELIDTTHVQAFSKENYRTLLVSNQTRWSDQTFDGKIYFDFGREKRGSDCRVWFITIHWEDRRDYINFEFDCERSDGKYDVVLLCNDNKEVGVLYDDLEDQVYYLYQERGCT